MFFFLNLTTTKISIFNRLRSVNLLNVFPIFDINRGWILILLPVKKEISGPWLDKLEKQNQKRIIIPCNYEIDVREWSLINIFFLNKI